MNDEVLTFTLPYPPQMNHLYTVVRGRKILSQQGRSYRVLAATVARRALGPRRPLTGALSVSMTIYRPRRAGDIDNLFKAPFDAMKRIVWGDDGQVRKLTAVLDDDPSNPRLEMTVTRFSSADREPLFHQTNDADAAAGGAVHWIPTT